MKPICDVSTDEEEMAVLLSPITQGFGMLLIQGLEVLKHPPNCPYPLWMFVSELPKNQWACCTSARRLLIYPWTFSLFTLNFYHKRALNKAFDLGLCWASPALLNKNSPGLQYWWPRGGCWPLEWIWWTWDHCCFKDHAFSARSEDLTVKYFLLNRLLHWRLHECHYRCLSL